MSAEVQEQIALFDNEGGANPPADESSPAIEDSSSVSPQPPRETRDEIERLDPEPQQLALMSGTEIDVLPLKLRQFLRLLRIVTRGAAGILDTSTLTMADEQVFLQELMALVLFSVPEAEEETVDFVKSMVVPHKQYETGQQQTDAMNALALELDNPELEDLVTILQAIVVREGSDLRALGKRLNSMFKVADKMGATKPERSQPATLTS